ncbi:hypothetical protein CMK11_03935 [Candidatus Poribacteria bacterium]|nr:hypothetical protein [Candidatus Poribacteria bacterium]
MAWAQSARAVRIHDLVATRLGVPNSQPNTERIARVLEDRARATGIAAAERYLSLLTGATDAGRREWDALAAALTVGESFFFRDSGLFEALRSRLLPELLDARSSRIRVWSAGCSDGQELYTVAMLLHDMARPTSGARLIGTDVNPAALATARRGRYDAWSFRGVDKGAIARHFAPRGDGFELNESVRRGVTFRRHNLIGDPCPDPAAGLDAMDIILCRNVLIYFAPDVVDSVARKLVQCLRPGGYLIVGNAEMHSRQLHGVVPRHVGDHVVYRRPDSPEASPPPAAATRDSSNDRLRGDTATSRHGGDTPTAEDEAGALLDIAREALDHGDSVQAEAVARRAGALDPRSAQAWLVAAHAGANLGKHEAAREACRAAIEASPFSSEAHLVLARIADELGEPGEAKALIRKAIYLDGQNANAYLTLASLYDRGGEARRAARAYRGALRILEARGAEEVEDEDIVGFVHARIEELNAGA